ncbi:MAG: ribosome biogenesis GTPase Der [Alphaproteobacteria bacterium]|nr:ribosome biogenesis GTPase Der [Alphaproteobacteria bacterium]
MALPVVAVVGRPNVGKSTLFNRLVGSKTSIVHDRPGVTRDRLYEEAELLSRRVLLIDTGGLEPEPDTDLLKAMRAQSLVAVEEAHVILLVVDAQTGWTPADDDVATLLRRSDKPVILVVNKVDGTRHEALAADFWATGIDPLLTVSAEHGRGIYELCEAIEAALPPAGADETTSDDDGLDEDDLEALDEGLEPAAGPIRIAVIGRPNIGKSTLINRLLGEDRHLVFDMPGTTMDPVDSGLRVGDRDYVLVDTAGVRKRARIDDKLERFVSLRSIRAIERCHVSLLLIDGTEGPTEQDAKLAQLVIDRGRALAILINKWDLTKELEEVDSRGIGDALAQRFPHATWAPHLFISAKTGKGVHRVLPMVDQIYAEFDKRVPTARLNRFLEAAVAAHSPPQKHHHPVRLYYMAQARVRPPTFVAFTNTPDGIGPAYVRYLGNQLREAFGFEGTPVKVHVRKRRKLGEEAR